MRSNVEASSLVCQNSLLAVLGGVEALLPGQWWHFAFLFHPLSAWVHSWIVIQRDQVWWPPFLIWPIYFWSDRWLSVAATLIELTCGGIYLLVHHIVRCSPSLHNKPGFLATWWCRLNSLVHFQRRLWGLINSLQRFNTWVCIRSCFFSQTLFIEQNWALFVSVWLQCFGQISIVKHSHDGPSFIKWIGNFFLPLRGTSRTHPPLWQNWGRLLSRVIHRVKFVFVYCHDWSVTFMRSPANFTFKLAPSDHRSQALTLCWVIISINLSWPYFLVYKVPSVTCLNILDAVLN